MKTTLPIDLKNYRAPRNPLLPWVKRNWWKIGAAVYVGLVIFVK